MRTIHLIHSAPAPSTRVHVPMRRRHTVGPRLVGPGILAEQSSLEQARLRRASDYGDCGLLTGLLLRVFDTVFGRRELV